jgi:hypothetical protein
MPCCRFIRFDLWIFRWKSGLAGSEIGRRQKIKRHKSAVPLSRNFLQRYLYRYCYSVLRARIRKNPKVFLLDPYPHTGTGTGTVFCRDAPDTVFAGYPAGRISAGYLAWHLCFSKISTKFIKTALKIIDFCKHKTKHDLVNKLIFVQIFFICLIWRKTKEIIGSGKH